MCFLWEMMHLPLTIAMVAIAQFSQRADSCAFGNDQFSYSSVYFSVGAFLDSWEDK
jgi:hypothetical protein